MFKKFALISNGASVQGFLAHDVLNKLAAKLLINLDYKTRRGLVRISDLPKLRYKKKNTIAW